MRASRKNRLRIIAIGAVMICLHTIAAAIDAGKYADRVNQAETVVAEYISLAADEDVDLDTVHEQDLAERITELVPESEKIETAGGTIETDNRWLAAKLKTVQETEDRGEKTAILAAISGRLAAIADEADSTHYMESSAATKDQNKQRLENILKRPEYAPAEESEENFIQRAVRQFWEWLMNRGPATDRSSMPAPPSQESVRVVLLVLGVFLLGILAFAVYKLAPLLRSRHATRRGREKKGRIILGENIAPEETSTTLFADAEALALSGDLRGAIRKGYIAALCEISDRGFVRLARYKTNRDYLLDVRPRPEIYRSVSDLTSTFERHWYGKQDASSADWERFRTAYGEMVAELK